jgi:putative adenylate-forming enzyme
MTHEGKFSNHQIVKSSNQTPVLKLKILYQLLAARFQPKFKSRQELEHWQERQIQKHLKRILLKSPFYQKRLEEHGHWSKFPAINKSIFMENFDHINTAGIAKADAMRLALQAEASRDFSPMINGIAVGLSTGTSGNRGIFLASIDERAAWVAYVVRNILGFQLKRRKVAFFLRANSKLYSSTQSRLLDFNFFDLLTPIEENLKRLQDYQPNIIVAQPSMLLEIAAAQEELKLAPQKIISVAEVLEPTDQAYLEKIFQQKIHQVYQCTEGLLARTCKHGVLHFNEDLVKIEKKYIDEERKRYHPIITDFRRSTQPLIRYELNDIIIDKEEPCACGSIFQAIEKIEGRSDDCFLLQNKNGEEIKIFPDFVRRAIVRADEQLLHYIVEQQSPTHFQIYLESSDFEQSKRAIKNSLDELWAHYGIPTPSYNFEEGLPPIGADKLRRLRRVKF